MRAWAPMAAALISANFSAGASANPGQDYMLYCMGCHGADGQGVAGKIPPLARTLVPFMRTPEGRNYLLRVPGAANSALPDAELAAVLNWLAERYTPSGTSPPTGFTTEEVSRVRHTPLINVRATRGEVVRALELRGAAPAAEY